MTIAVDLDVKNQNQQKTTFSRQRGVSSRPKHMRMDAKTVSMMILMTDKAAQVINQWEIV